MNRTTKGILIFVTLIATQSCVERIDTPNPQTTIKVQDLKVPQTFDWVTSKNITCNIQSNTSAAVSIYTDSKCEDELLAILTTQQGSTPLSFSVSKATDQLYLKYTNSSNASKILVAGVSDNVATFNITDATSNIVDRSGRASRAPIYDGGGFISYPAGWGTVMFEDLFPALGDYDFNDFVATYQIAVEFPWRNGAYDTKHANQIRIHLKLKAIGGSLDFTPYVRIVGLNKNIVSLPTAPYNDPKYKNPLIYNNTTDGVATSMVNSTLTNDVIIKFANLNATNPNRVNGVPYYNTTPGAMMKANQLTEVVAYLALSEDVDVANLLDENIDIFLASPDKSKEIHARGFNPVFSPYNFDANGVHRTIPYASEGNLIWGMKVYKAILHTIEKANFCEAYNDFGSWAQSGGVANSNWYTTNVVKKNLIEWAK